jgi:hypothetical protein
MSDNNSSGGMERIPCDPYIPNEEIFLKQLIEFENAFKKYCVKSGKRKESFLINVSIVVEIHRRADQLRVHYEMHHGKIDGDKKGIKMNELKTTAALCYWMIKHKPIMYIANVINNPTQMLYLENCDNNFINIEFSIYLLTNAVNFYRDKIGKGKVDITCEHQIKGHQETETSLAFDLGYFLKHRVVNLESLLIITEVLAKHCEA